MSQMTGEVMSTHANKFKSQIILSVSVFALAAFAQTAGAQEASVDLTASELPPIVVEGTTVAPEAATRKRQPTRDTPIKVPANRGSVPSQTGNPTGAGQSAAAAQGASGDLDLSNEATGGVEYVSPGRLLQNQGTSTTVLTSEDLNRQQIRHAADALRSLPGVAVSRSGGPQSITSVRIRGAESNHTLVLIDGVEVNAADAAFDFSNLTTDDIDQIEVLRGPQSALFSSGALGGVVNIRTKSGKGPLTVAVRGEIGTQNTQNGSISLSGGNDNLHGIFTASGLQTDGYNLSLLGNEDDGAKFSTLSFSGGVMVFPGLKVDLTLRKSRNDSDRDDFDIYGADGFGQLTDTASRFESVLNVGRIAATLDTWDGKWVHKWQIGGSETNLNDYGRGAFGSDSRFETDKINYSYRSTYRIDTPNNPLVTHYLTGLIDHNTESYQQQGFSSVDVDMERTGVAAELSGEYFRSLFLSAAVRHDKNDSFDDYTTWQTTASYRLPGSMFRVHGAAGSGVKYPSLLELYGEFGPGGFISNPNLKPEESIGWDAGIETTLFGGRAIIDVTYFNQKLENEIGTLSLPGFAYTAVNALGESTREGIEVAGRFAVAKGLDVGLSYTYLRARENAQEEIRRPPHSGRVDVNYRFLDDRANVNLAAAYVGDRVDQAYNILVPPFGGTARLALDEYWLLTLGASYLITPNMEIYGRVENALDERYTEIIGIDSAPVAAYVGMKIKFDDPNTFGSSK